MAALTSSRTHPALVQQLTPPSSSHGAGGSWEYAVPLDNPSATHEADPYMPHNAASVQAPRQPHTMQANGFAKPVRSPTWGSQNQDYDSERINELHSKPSGDLGAIGADQDSVIEYYKSLTSNKKGSAGAKGKPRKRPLAGAKADAKSTAPKHDENHWIHRDKLKEIEIREMEEAGFRIGRASRSNSRSRSDARRVVSPLPAEDEHEAEEHQTHAPTAYREFAPDRESSSPQSTAHNARPSTSRIPLPKTSGIPVSAAVAERDAPLPRSRAGSESWNVDALAANGARVRSGSIASQFLLDDPEDDARTTPPYGHKRKVSSSSGSPPKSPQKSPQKAKTPAKSTPTSGARKTSLKVAQKNRQPSGTTPTKRPGTSGGGAPRPSTSHRPEGEAPWLATMYKTDPRLPPDQQIIPTHAKRMQREQWENEGRVASMYDKDFQMLNTEDFQDKRQSQTLELQSTDLEKAQTDGTWPLPSTDKKQPPSLEKLDTNTNKNEQGAYKLTPTIPQSPCVPSPPRVAPQIAPPSTSPPNTTRVPEPVEEAKEKKGCCCIVM